MRSKKVVSCIAAFNSQCLLQRTVRCLKVVIARLLSDVRDPLAVLATKEKLYSHSHAKNSLLKQIACYANADSQLLAKHLVSILSQTLSNFRFLRYNILAAFQDLAASCARLCIAPHYIGFKTIEPSLDGSVEIERAVYTACLKTFKRVVDCVLTRVTWPWSEQRIELSKSRSTLQLLLLLKKGRQIEKCQ